MMGVWPSSRFGWSAASRSRTYCRSALNVALAMATFFDGSVRPGTDVLRNSRGIRDPVLLARFESDATAIPLTQLEVQPLPGRFDLAHLQDCHRHIFGAVYPWAGQLRTVAIAKGDVF